MLQLRELARQVEKVFAELAQIFSGFQTHSGLTCNTACGTCCNNPQVEATVLEMLPLALSFFDLGRAEQVLDELDLYSGFSCYHYTRHSLDGSKGACSVYQQRPGICRMFGAAGVKDKHGKARLSVCRIIKEEKADPYQVALIAIQTNPVPSITDGKARLRQLDYALGKKDMPINLALKTAIEKVLFQSGFDDSETTNRVA